MTGLVDVLVVGAGPAGRALAGHCAALDLDTILLDPDPNRSWRPIYAGWAHSLPRLPATTIAAEPRSIAAFGTHRHDLPGRYLILANDELRSHLSHPDVGLRTGRAIGIRHDRWGSTVRLSDGHTVRARVVVDATGASRSLSRTRRARRARRAQPPSGRLTQTAAGVILSAADAAALLDGAEAVFMDWRQPRSTGGPRWPTFLYAVPIGLDRVLVEETSLARRPGLPITDLRARLADRLARAGITGPGDERLTDGRLAETVRIPLDLSTPPRGRVVPFGAAASLVHPATGYGLGDMLRAAPLVAATIADALPRGPNRAAAAAHRQLWSPRARAVQWLRRRGLTVLLGLPPGHMARFFDLFFDLPGPLQHAYLNERENLAGTATAMARLFKIAPWPLRVTLAVAMSEHNPTV